MTQNGIMIFICFLLVGCQVERPDQNAAMGKYSVDEAESISYDDEYEIEPPRSSEPPAPPEFDLGKGSKVIKNGDMDFEVVKLEVAKTRTDSILATANGYYEREQYNSHGNRNSYSLQLRMPAARFDTIVKLLEKGVGELRSKNLTAKDVTEEYVDLNIRLENNLSYLTQYKEILRKAKSVKEILEVQERIRNIEEEIESKKGRLKFLDDKIKYSTLNLELTEFLVEDRSAGPTFGTRIASAFQNGIRGFLSFVVGLVNLWPFLLFLLIIFVARKPLLNSLKSKKINKK